MDITPSGVTRKNESAVRNSPMVDITKQMSAWKRGSEEDREVARELISNHRIRPGLFFAHLALEKIFKAHVCRHTHDLAPRIHNLVRLAEVAALQLQPDQLDVLAEMNAFHMEGWYPEFRIPNSFAHAPGSSEVFLPDRRGFLMVEKSVVNSIHCYLQVLRNRSG